MQVLVFSRKIEKGFPCVIETPFFVENKMAPDSKKRAPIFGQYLGSESLVC